MAEKMLREKIGYRAGQRVLLLDLPAGVADPFAGVEHAVDDAGSVKVANDLKNGTLDLILAFTLNSAALAATARVVTAAAGEDTKLWIAYPKKTGALETDLARDRGWAPMFAAGWIVVAIASIDATWSALRFRPRHLVQSIRYPA